MAVVRKPAVVAERDVDAVIRRGGAAPAGADAAAPARSRPSVVVRLPPDLLDRVDAAVAARAVPITRHSWILEALHEKVLRESAPVGS